MNMIYKYKWDNFGDTKLDAIAFFVQYSIGHKEAADLLLGQNNPWIYDSAAYLYHIALEQLFKSILLNNKGEFVVCHDLIKLSEDVFETNADQELKGLHKEFMRLINEYQHLRYPLDDIIRNKYHNSSTIGEIGTEELEAIKGFYDQLIIQLRENETIKKIFDQISQNPHKKGKRVLLKKKKKSK